MIVFVEGTLVEASPLRAVINVHGIGYALHIPVTTAEKLPRIGSQVKLHAVAVYREDSQALYGFYSTDERDFFQLLVEKVSGIGPKIAISILSHLSVEALRNAISQGDVALLAKCPGIGKKTAERLVVELRDKVGISPGSSGGINASGDTVSAATETSVYHDALAALISLGFKPADADKALRKAREKLPPDSTAEELIKAAFK